jgi:type IV pilus assembly protein PilB
MATTTPYLSEDPAQETARARALAARYYQEFVDLREVRIDHDLFHSIPVDLMFRYNFVPIQGQNGTLEIALADPRNPSQIDELGALLGKRLRVKVATMSQISDFSRRPSSRSASSKRSPKVSRSTSSATRRTRTRRSPSTASPPRIPTSPR